MSYSRRVRDKRTRATLVAFLVIALGMGTAACSPAEAPSPSTPTPGPQAAPNFPVNIAHKFGTTTIPAPPKRVVVVGTSTDDLDATLALGVTPVAFFSKDQATPDGRYPWLTGRLDPAKTQVVSSPSSVNLEKVVETRPDLILATGDFGLDQEFANLSKVAPTIGYEHQWGQQTWQQHVQVVGTALGKTTEADQLIAQTEAKIAAVRQRYSGLGGKTFSVSMAASPAEVFTLVSPQDFAVKQIEQLGMKLAPGVAGAEQVSGSPTGMLSPEQLDKLNAHLVVTAFATPEARRAFESNPLVRNLPAVRDGSYVVADMQTITQLRYPSVLGIPWILDKLGPGLEKAANAR